MTGCRAVGEASPNKAQAWDTAVSPCPQLPALPSHTPTSQTPTCVSAARRGMEAARPWLSSPGWGSPSGPLRVMLCIWTSTAWETADPQTHQSHPTLASPPSMPLPHPCLSRIPSHPHPLSRPHPHLITPLPALGVLTGFPACTTGISVEWPRSRGLLASQGTSWVLWVPQETDSLMPLSWVCLWRREDHAVGSEALMQ